MLDIDDIYHRLFVIGYGDAPGGQLHKDAKAVTIELQMCREILSLYQWRKGDDGVRYCPDCLGVPANSEPWRSNGHKVDCRILGSIRLIYQNHGEVWSDD